MNKLIDYFLQKIDFLKKLVYNKFVKRKSEEQFTHLQEIIYKLEETKLCRLSIANVY